VEVSIHFAGRIEPYVFLTVVTAPRRRPTPLAAVFWPRSEEVPAPAPAPDTPAWLEELHRAYEVHGAPEHLLRTVVDQRLAASLCALRDTEVEILPQLVNVQLREVVWEAGPVRPLLDLAVELLSHLDRLHDQLAAFTLEDARRGGAEVDAFIRWFRARVIPPRRYFESPFVR
jgi:hypothetical protein